MSAKRAKANSELKRTGIAAPHPQDFFPYWNLKLDISLLKRKTNWFKSLCSCRKTLSFESTSYHVLCDRELPPSCSNRRPINADWGYVLPDCSFLLFKSNFSDNFLILFRASNHKRCRQRESKLICIWSLISEFKFHTLSPPGYLLWDSPCSISI